MHAAEGENGVHTHLHPPLPPVPPGPPVPWIVDTGKDSVVVAWKPPLFNGGGDILGYHVEKV